MNIKIAVLQMKSLNRQYQENTSIVLAKRMGNTYRKVDAYAALSGKEIRYPFIRENQGDH